MAATILTDVGVRQLRPAEGHQKDFCDAKVTGLALRVSRGGTKTWIVLYRVAR